MITIGELAKLSGVAIGTIRFYETKGIIEPQMRDEHNNRLFDREQADWLLFVRHLRETGMSVADIHYYRELVEQGLTTIPERTQMLEAQRSKVLAEIAASQARLDHLDLKLDRYTKGYNC